MDNFNIGESLNNGLDQLFGFLPQLLGALLLVIVGYFVALILKSIVTKLLRQVRFDRALHSSPAGNYVARLVDSPSRFVGKVVFWLGNFCCN